MRHPVAIALGSNLGDRASYIHSAAAALTGFVGNLQLSSLHDTAPVGVGGQPRFLNAAAVGTTDLPPVDLLRRLLDVERQFGRERPFPGAPRTIDLDLILFAQLQLDTPELVVPHPRFRERRFVLAPLAEIAAAWIDPVSGRSVAQLLGEIGEVEEVEK